MNEHTLTVPAEYAEHFRAAMVEEIAFDAGMLQRERGRTRCREDEPADKSNAADLRWMTDQLTGDAALFEQMGHEGEIEVRTADVGALAHACETMAEKVIGPEITHHLSYAPLDPEALRPLIDGLSWAVEKVAELTPAALAQTREMAAAREMAVA